MRNLKLILSGIGIGAVNSLFGSGGGLLAVPTLKKDGLTQKQAQANSIAVILPLSAISTVIYLKKSYFALNEGLLYLPFGLTGAIFGMLLLKRLSGNLLNKIFSLLLIYSGLRLLTGW